jgi:hypothetical protein
VVANSLFITGKLEKKNLDLDQGNWRQHNRMDKRNSGTEIYIEEGI